MPRRAWTGSDRKWLAENYQKLGAKACAEHLGNATVGGVRDFAQKHGFTRRAADIQYPPSDFVDAAIRRCHASGSAQPWTDASRQVGRPVRWVRKRAEALGLRVRRERSPWTKGETDFVLKRLHWPAHRIAAEMQENGWKRTLHAVQHFLRSQGLQRSDTSHMTAEGAAAALGVALSSLRRWIDTGLLIAERRDPTPGGYKSIAIAEEDLAAFILLNPERIDFIKIERARTKTWFLDLISRFPKPPSKMDDYLRRQIASLRTFRPDFDNERIATTLGVEEKTVREAVAHAREIERQRVLARAQRREQREAA
jgi:hypothetical protein